MFVLLKKFGYVQELRWSEPPPTYPSNEKGIRRERDRERESKTDKKRKIEKAEKEPDKKSQKGGQEI